MSETPNGDATAAGDAPVLRVLAQYVKDLSFENPGAPQSLRSDTGAPNIEVNVDVNGRSLGEGQYEVEFSCAAKASRDNETVFIVETTYAGLFLLQNIPQEQIEPALLIECPRLLFPFARRVIADAVRDGGFPPLMLEPIDFFGMYRQQQARAQQAASQGETQTPPDAS